MDYSINKFELEDVSLHYVIQGEGEPVLFIQGLISDFRTWTYQLDYLSRYYKVIAISRRFQYPASYIKGGKSGIQINTDDIMALLKHLNLSKISIVGHSYGGYIAINLASKNPNIIKKLVVEEPIVTALLTQNPYNPFHWLRLMSKSKDAAAFAYMGFRGFNAAVSALSKGDVDTAKRAFIRTLFRVKKTPEDLDELSKIQLDDNIRAMSGEDPTKHKFSPMELSEISCDTMILSGDKSSCVFDYISDELSKRIPKCTQIKIKDSSHWIHIDQKDQYNQYVHEFLK